MKRLLIPLFPAAGLSCALAASLIPISVRGPGQVPAIMASGASGGAEFGAERSTLFFLSDAPDLVDVPSLPGNIELYRQDLVSGSRIRVSLPSPDGGGTGDVRAYSLAADGNRVIYTRAVTSPGGWPREDLFLRDLPAGVPRWVRLERAEVPDPAGIHSTASLSGDGRWLVFDSTATTLVTDPDANLGPDVFRRNLETGVTELLSRTADGQAGDRGAMLPQVSHDGTTVVFVSDATNLAPLTGYATALIVWQDGREPRRLSLPGTPATPLTAPIAPDDVVLSADGRFLAFTVTGRQPAELNAAWWCDLHDDRCLAASGSFALAGDPLSLSADGRTLAITIRLGSESTRTNQVRVWSEATGLRTLDELRLTMPPTVSDPASSSVPVLSPDASHILFSSPSAIPEAGVAEAGEDRLYCRVLATGETRLLSTDGSFPGPVFSADGSRIAFQMQEPVVTPGDGNGTFDVVAVTLPSYERQLVSTASSTGTRRTATGNSLSATGISDDGRLAVFTSAAPDLVTGGGGTVYSGFVFDQSSGTNRHVGQRPDGTAFSRSVLTVQLARTGRQVVFVSDEAFLTPGDTNTLNDAFVQDLETRVLTLASARDQSDESLDGLTSEPRISAGGRWVAFLNESTLSGGFRPTRNLFLRDLEGRRTHWINDPARTDGNVTVQPVVQFDLSADGSTVAFLVTGPSGGVLVHRRDWPRLKRIASAAGGFALSADGQYVYASRTLVGGIELHRYTLATGESQDLGTLPAGSFADLQCSADGAVAAFCHRPASLPLQPLPWQVWSLAAADPTPRLESSTAGGEPGNNDSRGPQLSAAGRHLVFRSFASNLASRDFNQTGDVFHRDRYSGTLSLLSQTPTGETGNGPSTRPHISGDGRFATFTSYANNLVPDDANDASDVILATLAITTPTDSDNDGLPDRWELDHLGTLTHHGNQDSDLDLQSNSAEWAARTDPSDATSRLMVSGVTWAEGAPRVEWSGRAGVRYQLERRPNLSSPADWIPIGDAIQGSEGPLRAGLSEPADSGFYRLRVLP